MSKKAFNRLGQILIGMGIVCFGVTIIALAVAMGNLGYHQSFDYPRNTMIDVIFGAGHATLPMGFAFIFGALGCFEMGDK